MSIDILRLAAARNDCLPRRRVSHVTHHPWAPPPAPPTLDHAADVAGGSFSTWPRPTVRNRSSTTPSGPILALPSSPSRASTAGTHLLVEDQGTHLAVGDAFRIARTEVQLLATAERYA